MKQPTLDQEKFLRVPAWRKIISFPIIYGMIIPLVFLDICMEVYHRICFPLYGIATLKRSHYIIVDRHHLKRLTFLQKINCVYCGYANGLAAYLTDICADTEKYWCAVKHANKMALEKQPHQVDFLERSEFE